MSVFWTRFSTLPTLVQLIAGLAAAGALAYFGMAAAVVAAGLYLSTPTHSRVGEPPAIPGLQAIEIRSESGSRLKAWFIPGRSGGGAVLLMHGVWSSRSNMAHRAELLSALGFAVLLFDFQAHGESAGTRITFGYREALDAAAAAAFLRREAPGERIGAIGVSMGGAAALVGAAPLPVDALVLESVYPDIDAALANRLHSHLGPVIGAAFVPLLTPLFKTLLPPILGVSPEDLRPIDRIDQVTAPLLVASGTIDDRTPLAEAQALFDHARAPKRSWWVPGAGHVDLEAADPVDYRRVVIGFLTEELQRAPP